MNQKRINKKVEFWQRRVVKYGSVCAALVAIGGITTKTLDAVDSRYALASETRDIHRDLLELRRDTYIDKRQQLERAQRQRRLSDFEMNEMGRVDNQIRDIDRRLDKLEKRGIK